MKYMILTYGSQRDYDLMTGKAADGPAPADFAPMYEFMAAFNTELASSGELIDTRGLTAPVHARRLGSRDGAAFVTDGPYAETQEVLAGYWIVECDSFDRATEIAGRMANCPSPGGIFANSYVDIRPIADAAADIDF